MSIHFNKRKSFKPWVLDGHWAYFYTEFYNKLYFLMASLITQLVKNPPAMQETLVCFLGQEDHLEKR